MHVSLKRAQYFITCKGKYYRIQDPQPQMILRALKPNARSPYEQLTLFPETTAAPQSDVEVLNDNDFFPAATVPANSAKDLLPAF